MSVTALECVAYWHRADVMRSALIEKPRGPGWQDEWDTWSRLADNAALALAKAIPSANEPLFFRGGDAA